MPLEVNGVEISNSAGGVKLDGTSVAQVNVNGTKVWPSGSEPSTVQITIGTASTQRGYIRAGSIGALSPDVINTPWGVQEVDTVLAILFESGAGQVGIDSDAETPDMANYKVYVIFPGGTDTLPNFDRFVWKKPSPSPFSDWIEANEGNTESITLQFIPN
jgi:hypothetical protein